VAHWYTGFGRLHSGNQLLLRTNVGTGLTAQLAYRETESCHLAHMTLHDASLEQCGVYVNTAVIEGLPAMVLR
jgi:hypothetical protein